MHEDGTLHLLLSISPNSGYPQVARISGVLQVNLLYPVGVITLNVLDERDDKRPHLHGQTSLKLMQHAPSMPNPVCIIHTLSLSVKGGPIDMAFLFSGSGFAVENNCTSAAPAPGAQFTLETQGKGAEEEAT